MAEHNFEITELLEKVPAPNGHVDDTAPVDVAAQAEAPQAHVDPVRGVFITSKGTEIELSGKLITILVLERIANQGKPKIPMVEVTLIGGRKQLEANPNHEGYKAQLAEWEDDSRMRQLRYVYTMGVKGKPSQEFIDEQRSFFPTADDIELKYLWVASLIPNDDIAAFSEAVTGQMLPTAKGIEEAANFTA